MDKLVSVLTPCYNGEKYISRLLDSILNQTYPQIEMFVIDDGSKDNSAEVIKSYIPKFKSNGYRLEYIYQNNAGQSVAINNGLKIVNGDYLVWPDCDDFYATNTAIEELVDILDNSEDSVCMVRCCSYLLDENTLKPIGKYQTCDRGKMDLFEDCLFGSNGFCYIPGDYMAKFEKIEKYIQNKEIYTERHAGQNWQLMLPLLYNGKCLTTKKFLYNILDRKGSYSRGQYSTEEQILNLLSTHENTIVHTIENIHNMPIVEKENYIQKIKDKYLKNRYISLLRHRKFKEAKTMICFENFHMRIQYYFYHIFATFFFKKVYRFFKKTFR
jgi:glycosyltransferase involved in cell wall biosynthesis